MGIVTRSGGKSAYSAIQNGRIEERYVTVSINTALAAAEIDSGTDLPNVAGWVEEVFVNVRVAEATGATKTLDVGILSTETGGDADGFVDGLDVSTTGMKRLLLTGGATSVRGALIREVLTPNVPQQHIIAVTATGRSISYTPGSAFTEFRGDIIFKVCAFVAN